jgi:hypothetical protein
LPYSIYTIKKIKVYFYFEFIFSVKVEELDVDEIFDVPLSNLFLGLLL